MVILVEVCTRLVWRWAAPRSRVLSTVLRPLYYILSRFSRPKRGASAAHPIWLPPILFSSVSPRFVRRTLALLTLQRSDLLTSPKSYTRPDSRSLSLLFSQCAALSTFSIGEWQKNKMEDPPRMPHAKRMALVVVEPVLKKIAPAPHVQSCSCVLLAGSSCYYSIPHRQRTCDGHEHLPLYDFHSHSSAQEAIHI